MVILNPTLLSTKIAIITSKIKVKPGAQTAIFKTTHSKPYNPNLKIYRFDSYLLRND